ncbi:uncharacterized protein B0I36DRAFT_382743 [Microdochium trichocladiopsis]|uniref:Apple domain-containing protein n=1 Tax=Microdochium trichocladiopsis TaxID=1682393 RepID=A0A9P9BRB7_9PEZI|nr:uncharacterized protein B0I36DRAFT_382743 [Microdochium trichocladiopsis]KAH7032726.1 hypothetical protein B0I36DRAFT_382743 [Microdochium trichocladiopsis]
MKLSVYLVPTLALAVSVAASPGKKHSCGNNHTPTHALLSSGPAGIVCTRTSTAVRVITSTSTTTSTPVAVLITTTKTSTSTGTRTQAQVTTTLSSTATVYTTDTRTATATASITTTAATAVTVTSVSPTVTVATPAGFTPIGQAFPGNSNKRRRSPIGKLCTSTTVKTITSTSTCISTSTVKAATPTSTITALNTRFTTTTVLPQPASTILTSVTTAALTITTTTTITTITATTATSTTTLLIGPAPTSYAACGPDNYLSTYQGMLIGGFGSTSPDGGTPISLAGSTKEECCASCMANPTCAFAGFGVAAQTCLGYEFPTGGTCDPTRLAGNFFPRDNPVAAVADARRTFFEVVVQ